MWSRATHAVRVKVAGVTAEREAGVPHVPAAVGLPRRLIAAGDRCSCTTVYLFICTLNVYDNEQIYSLWSFYDLHGGVRDGLDLRADGVLRQVEDVALQRGGDFKCVSLELLYSHSLRAEAVGDELEEEFVHEIVQQRLQVLACVRQGQAVRGVLGSSQRPKPYLTPSVHEFLLRLHRPS